jgi:hypothetical protein
VRQLGPASALTFPAAAKFDEIYVDEVSVISIDDVVCI